VGQTCLRSESRTQRNARDILKEVKVSCLAVFVTEVEVVEVTDVSLMLTKKDLTFRHEGLKQGSSYGQDDHYI
jgi:hypothetical protein